MQRRAALLAVLAASAAVFLTALDQTVVVTALPHIIVDLQIPVTQLDRAAWIISGYLLGYVVAMPLMGRVSDMYGRRRVFITCLCIFALGSLFCALAPVLGDNVSLDFLQGIGIDVSSPGLIWLVAARFVQAAGGGAVVPVAMAGGGGFYRGSGQGSAPIQNNPWLIAAALVLLATFIAFEIYAERVNNRAQVMQRLTRVWPIVEPSLFKRVTFSAAALASLLVGTALIIAMVDI